MSEVGRTKKNEIVFPTCADARPCRFRDDKGKCIILTSTYKNGECPWCKEKNAEAEKPVRKKKPMSAGQVVNSYFNLSAKHTREPDCEWYVGTKRSRLECKATHNESCKGCRFYSANKAKRTEAVAAYLLQTDKDMTQMRGELRNLRRATKHLDELTEYARIGKSVVRYANKRREKTHE